MSLDLCVSCPNEDCDFHREPIRLLFASLGRTADGLVRWPRMEQSCMLHVLGADACPFISKPINVISLKATNPYSVKAKFGFA
jgi:hypothetical protein